MNCWEFKKCSVKEKCPAYPRHGERCWGVEGTKCFGQTQGGYRDKIEQCRECDFYTIILFR